VQYNIPYLLPSFAKSHKWWKSQTDKSSSPNRQQHFPKASGWLKLSSCIALLYNIISCHLMFARIRRLKFKHTAVREILYYAALWLNTKALQATSGSSCGRRRLRIGRELSPLGLPTCSRSNPGGVTSIISHSPPSGAEDDKEIAGGKCKAGKGIGDANDAVEILLTGSFLRDFLFLGLTSPNTRESSHSQQQSALIAAAEANMQKANRRQSADFDMERHARNHGSVLTVQ